MGEEVLEREACKCHGDDECTCGNECHCGDDCTCNDNCECKNVIDEEKEHMNKLNDAYNKISELEDKLIRQNADMVNYRKRKEEAQLKIEKIFFDAPRPPQKLDILLKMVYDSIVN